jgi:hypothetical protein
MEGGLMLTKIGFILCGAALCGTTYTLIQQQRQIRELTQLVGEPAREAGSTASAAAPPVALVTRVRQLEAQLGGQRPPVRVERPARALRRYAPRAEAGAPMAGPAAAAPSSPGAVMDLLESDDPVLRERFRAVLQEEQQNLFEERREQQQARQAERSHERVKQLAARAQLSEQQLNWVNDTLDAEREQVSDVFAKAREDQNFPEARDKVRQIRAATDEQVKAQLKGDQFSAYQDMRDEDRRRFSGQPFQPPGGDRQPGAPNATSTN